MKLTLKNFKAHTDRVFEFPSTGLVQIKGRSGKGKSTIFSAVSHALWGSESSPYSHGTKSSSIGLVGFGLDITRQHGPAILRDNSTLEVDNTVQTTIKNKLFMTEEQFYCSSYIQQELQECLLTLSPGKQLEMIESLAFGEESPAIFKERIAEEISNCKSKLIIVRAKIEQETLNEVKRREALVTLQAQNSDIEPLGFNMEQVKSNFKNLTVEEKRLNKVLSDLVKEQNNPLHNLESTIAATQSRVESLIKDNDIQLKMLNAQKGQLLPHSLNSNDIQTSITNIRKDLSSAEQLQKLNQQLLDLKYGTIDIESILEEINVQKDEALAVFDKSNLHIAAITKKKMELEIASKSHTCPDCGVHLTMSEDGVLTHGKHVDDAEDKLKAAQAALQKATGNRNLAQNTLNQKDNQISMIQKIRNNLAEFPSDLKDPSSYKTDLVKLDSQMKVIQETKVALAKVDSQIDSLAKQSKRAKDELQVELAKRAQLKDLRSLETIQAEYKATEACLSGVAGSLSEAEIALEAISEYEKKLREKEGLIHQVTLLEKQILESQNSLRVLKDEESESASDLEASIELKDLSDKAASEAIAYLINDINLRASEYITKFFPEDGTIVELRNTKVVGKGTSKETIKPKLDLYILHKGYEYPSMKGMSGGEKARIILSFQVALSDLFSSPILMLDEPVTGLGTEDREQIYELLSEIGKNKLVLIAEHMIPDHVPELVVEV